MPAPADLALKLNRFVEGALAAELALDFNSHVVTDLGSRKKRVSWSEELPFNYLAYKMGTLDEYLYFLRDRHFSLVNLDGSILQISFEIHRSGIASHRLNFVPCPIELDASLLALDTLDNIVEQLFVGHPRQETRLRSSVRFDFDPAAASEAHPASHLTINYESVRIPVSRSLDAKTFLKFVWDNFFLPREIAAPNALVVAPDGGDDVLDVAHRPLPHMSWDPPL